MCRLTDWLRVASCQYLCSYQHYGWVRLCFSLFLKKPAIYQAGSYELRKRFEATVTSQLVLLVHGLGVDRPVVIHRADMF